MGWPKLHETERGVIVWRIFWEAGFLPRPIDDASFAFSSLGGVGGGGGAVGVGGAKMTNVCMIMMLLSFVISYV